MMRTSVTSIVVGHLLDEINLLWGLLSNHSAGQTSLSYGADEVGPHRSEG